MCLLYRLLALLLNAREFVLRAVDSAYEFIDLEMQGARVGVRVGVSRPNSSPPLLGVVDARASGSVRVRAGPPGFGVAQLRT